MSQFGIEVALLLPTMPIAKTAKRMLGAGLLAQALLSPLLLSPLLLSPLLLAPLLSQAPGAAAAGTIRQGAPRLLDCIESPYAYVALDAADVQSDQAGSGTIHQLLADRSLDAVFGVGADAEGRQSGSQQALGLVRSMLGRGARQLELAMTGIVAQKGLPLVVLRARLSHDQADTLRLQLEGAASLAVPSRKLNGSQTYTFVGGENRSAGEVVEMALVGDDVVVSNDTTAMREVLEPVPAVTGTQSTRRVLSADPQFRALRERLDVPAGSLLAFGDWQRLGRRLASHLDGVPAQLLSSSGLGSARSVMMSIAPANQDLAATLLLDFEVGEHVGESRGEGASSDGRRSLGIKGWLDASTAVSAKNLLRELPQGGLGGLVLSLDLTAVAAHSPRSSHMVWDLRDAYTGFGLSFERNLLDRLSSRGTVQLHFDAAGVSSAADGSGLGGSGLGGSGLGGSGHGASVAVASVHPVYSIRAKSRTAAEDLFSDLRRVVESTDSGSHIAIKDAKGKRLLDVLHLTGTAGRISAFVCVHDDCILLAESQDTLVQVQQELRRNKPRGRKDQIAATAIKSIGGDRVAGLFDLDLEPLFQRIASALNGVDLSALPKRHVGYLDTDRHEGGAVVRIRVLSSK